MYSLGSAGVGNVRRSSRHAAIIARNARGVSDLNSSKGLYKRLKDELDRCIPKMDHHCPWTNNCVSHFTFPHFVRFLFYAVVSMTYLESFLWTRGAYLWENRSLPSVRSTGSSRTEHMLNGIIVSRPQCLPACSLFRSRSGQHFHSHRAVAFAVPHVMVARGECHDHRVVGD